MEGPFQPHAQQSNREDVLEPSRQADVGQDGSQADIEQDASQADLGQDEHERSTQADLGDDVHDEAPSNPGLVTQTHGQKFYTAQQAHDAYQDVLKLVNGFMKRYHYGVVQSSLLFVVVVVA